MLYLQRGANSMQATGIVHDIQPIRTGNSKYGLVEQIHTRPATTSMLHVIIFTSTNKCLYINCTVIWEIVDFMSKLRSDFMLKGCSILTGLDRKRKGANTRLTHVASRQACSCILSNHAVAYTICCFLIILQRITMCQFILFWSKGICKSDCWFSK